MAKSKRRNYKPAPLLPFRLHNIKDFVHREHPEFHPVFEQELYSDYWDEQASLCLGGKWGDDSNTDTQEGGYRWMPGNLYFYINMTIIKIEADEGREVFAPPSLRDIEWYMFYALTEADGFSGFTGDEEYTCYYPVGKLQGKVKDGEGKVIDTLTNQDKIRLKRFDSSLRKPNGDYKTYITPREYLYKTWDKPMGVAQYYNEMKNLIVLSSRGVGKSYSISNGVIQYDFTFGSARTTDELWGMNHPSVSVVGAADSSKSKALLKKFEDSYEYLRKNVGANIEEGINSPFYQPYDGSLRTGSSITNGVKEEGGKSFTGTGSELWHVSYRDNASAGVGYRARRVVVEEAGLLSNFTEVHGENSGTQRRETKIGYTVYIGTGGNIEKIKGIREAFYDPFSFECVSFEDGFSNKPGQIGLFIPAYYRSLDFKDENGNTDIQAAFEDEMAIREDKRATGSRSYERHIISYPIVPAEMFLKSSGNIFPTDLIEDRLTDLETGEWKKLYKTGQLYYSNKDNTACVWRPLPLKGCSVIKRWGDEKKMTDDELKGTIVVFEHPVPHKPALSHYDYLYLVTYDSIRDEEGGTSLACVMVWKFWDFNDMKKTQFNLVAEWVGRHVGEGGLDKDHDIAFKLAAYYNAPIFPEINLKDVIRYGRMQNKFHYFLPKPQLAIDGMEIKQKKEYPVGLYISPQMKPDLEKYLNESLHTVVDESHTIVGKEEIFEKVKMVSQIPSMRYCEELIYYNREGNFDMVSSSMLFGVAKRQREEEPQMERKGIEEQKRNEELLKFIDGSQVQDSYNPRHDNPAFNY